MRGFAPGGSYERLAARAIGRTLDLACGDRRLADVAIDRAPGAATVRGDAHALPFAAASFDTITCHLAFMLFEDPARVVAELARVLAPDGRFLAVLGGGPTAEGGDALAWFAQRQGRTTRPARITEARWQALFAGWQIAPWERWLLELSGSLEDVAAALAAAANAPFDDLAGLRAAFPADPIPCRAVAWFAAARL